MVDPSELAEPIRLAAERHAVNGAIHPADFIFQFLMSHPGFSDKAAALDYYFRDGGRSCENFLHLVSEHLEEKPTPIRLLEFASGYGCVSRHLAKQADYEVTACDIHPAAMTHIETNFNLRTFESTSEPERFAPPTTYDVVFALSFFSHMPNRSWGRWLRALLHRVRPGGIMIFTTHGLRSSAKHFGNPTIGPDGIWFRADSEQKDLDVEEYGQTIVTPAFVFRQIAKHDIAAPVFFQEGFWWEHQDTYVVRRTA